MFRFVLNVLRRWYINRHRLLFTFWDGRRFRTIDPMRVMREVVAHPTINLDHGEFVDLGEEPYFSEWVRGLAEVYGVERFDPTTGRGLTDHEILNIFSDMEEYLYAIKKKLNPGPISSAPTASTSCESKEPLPQATN